jgi:hypothetical protein
LLLHACKGASLNKIVNAGQGEGTVAWRALVQRYDPNALAVRAGTLQSLLGWSFSGDVLERIEAWEREVAHYEALSGTALPEDLRIGIVLRQMDESPLKNHLILNAERFKLWKDFIAEITSVRLAMNATAGGQAPMDLGAVGTAGSFKGTCWKCGKQGHTSLQCWSGGDGKGKSKGKGKDGKSSGQSKGGKDKGKGKGKGKSKGKGAKGSCWTCGGQHLQKDCPRGVGSFEEWGEGDWHEDGWGDGDWVDEQQVATAPAPAPVQQPLGYLGGLFITSLEEMPEKSEEPVVVHPVPGVRVSRPTIQRMMISFVMWMLALVLAGFIPVDLVWNTGAAAELEPIGALGDGCEAVSFGVDSGAATTIVKSEVGRGYPLNIRESRQFMAANKTTLTTQGTVALECSDGARVRTQVGDVSKNLMSVAEMCDAGFDVIFSNTKGYKAVHGGTGAVLSFERVGKVFDLTLRVKRPTPAPVFRWQSRSS